VMRVGNGGEEGGVIHGEDRINGGTASAATFSRYVRTGCAFPEDSGRRLPAGSSAVGA
jgi:hypothetical protein